MNTAPSRAATNAIGSKRPLPSASEVPTSTGATAAGRVRTRAAITQMRTALASRGAATAPLTRLRVLGAWALRAYLDWDVPAKLRLEGRPRVERGAEARLSPPGKLGEVRRALLAVRVAALLGLGAAVEEEVGVVGELLDAGEPVLGGVERRLQQAQREGGEGEHLPAPPHRLLLQALQGHDGVHEPHLKRLRGGVLAAQEPNLPGLLGS